MTTLHDDANAKLRRLRFDSHLHAKDELSPYVYELALNTNLLDESDRELTTADRYALQLIRDLIDARLGRVDAAKGALSDLPEDDWRGSNWGDDNY